MQEVENIYGASVPAAGRSTTTVNDGKVVRHRRFRRLMVVAKKFRVMSGKLTIELYGMPRERVWQSRPCMSTRAEEQK